MKIGGSLNGFVANNIREFFRSLLLHHIPLVSDPFPKDLVAVDFLSKHFIHCCFVVSNLFYFPNKTYIVKANWLIQMAFSLTIIVNYTHFIVLARNHLKFLEYFKIFSMSSTYCFT